MSKPIANKSVHLGNDAWTKAKTLSTNLDITIKALIESLIFMETSKINCKLCTNPYCTQSGTPKIHNSCTTYRSAN